MKILTLFRRRSPPLPPRRTAKPDPLPLHQRAQHNYDRLHRAAMASERRAVDQR
jgi:hypothetical protein